MSFNGVYVYCVGFRDKEGSKDSPNSPFSDAHPPDFLRREDSKLDRLHLFHRRLRVVGVDGRHDAAHQRPTLEKDSKVSSCRGLKSSLSALQSSNCSDCGGQFHHRPPDSVHLARHFVTHCGAARSGPRIWFGKHCAY